MRRFNKIETIMKKYKPKMKILRQKQKSMPKAANRN
jgi:hypothetical protein